MNEHALAALLADVVRREIRTCAVFDAPARPTLPPPHDLDAEREVLEAVLSSRVLVRDLSPLAWSDFYSPSYSAFFRASALLENPARGVSLESVSRVLESQGLVGPELLDELHALRDGTPVCSRPKAAAARVILAARRRELCACMARVDGALRVGCEPPAEDRARVVELLGDSAWWP